MRYSFSHNCIVPFIYGMLVSFDILHCEILTSSNENIEIQQFLDVSYKNVHIICKSTLPLRWPSVALSGSGQVGYHWDGLSGLWRILIGQSGLIFFVVGVLWGGVVTL